MRLPLAAAAAVLAAAATVSSAAARPPSPARYLWEHTHAPGALVAVRCHADDTAAVCELVIQPNARKRSCWWVAMRPHGRSWQVVSTAAIEPARCPVLREQHHSGPRALKT